MDLKGWLELLEAKGLSLMIVKDGEIVFQGTDHGLRPLLEAVSCIAPSRLRGSTVVDRVVGKAGALLICRFQGKRVYAKTASRAALKLLERYGVSLEAAEVVEAIAGGRCPFEQAVMGIDDPEEGYRIITEIARSMQQTSQNH